jgi:hypothetical protein
MNNPIPRYTIGTIITKDIELWKRTKELMKYKYTLEDIVRRGVEELEQDSVKEMGQNNNA